MIPLRDLQVPDRGSAPVQSMPLLQGSDADARQVGTVFIRARAVEESRTSISRELEETAPSHRSGDMSRASGDFSSTTRSPRQAAFVEVPDVQPNGRTKSSPIAELGFFDASAQNTARNSRPNSLDDNFRVLQSDGKGTHLFDNNTPNARVFSIDRPRSMSPSRGRSASPPPNRASSSQFESMTARSFPHFDSIAARSSPATSPAAATRGASVLLLRAPPPGVSIMGAEVGVGVGLHMAVNGEFFISSIVDGTPAAFAAAADMLSLGDVVESIDGARCRGQPVEQVIAMIKGPADTPVCLELRRKEAPAPRPDAGRTSMLLVRLRESFFKLVPHEQNFSSVLIHDLSMCSNSYPERFKYMGMEDLQDEIEASIEVTDELPGLDDRSSRDICDMIIDQSSDFLSKLRQAPSMEQFRGIKHYLKANRQPQSVARPGSVAPASVSKLEAAMKSFNASKSARTPIARGNGDPLSSYHSANNDVELSIGNLASSLRLHSIAAMQVVDTDL